MNPYRHCTKRKFCSKQEARKALKSLRGNGKYGMKEVYECGYCPEGTWHMTSLRRGNDKN